MVHQGSRDFSADAAPTGVVIAEETAETQEIQVVTAAALVVVVVAEATNGVHYPIL